MGGSKLILSDKICKQKETERGHLHSQTHHFLLYSISTTFLYFFREMYASVQDTGGRKMYKNALHILKHNINAYHYYSIEHNLARTCFAQHPSKYLRIV